jgi:hypothetical protein
MGLLARVKELGSAIGAVKRLKAEIDQIMTIIKTHDSDGSGTPDYKEILDDCKKDFIRLARLVEVVIAEIKDES